MLPAYIVAIALSHSAPAPVLVSLNPLPAFPPSSNGAEFVYEPIDPGFDWDEAIASWNVKNAEGALLKVEGRVVRAEGSTVWCTFGVWSLDPTVRRSIAGQKDENSEVLTDTLRLATPGGKLQIRIFLERIGSAAGAPPPKLTLLTVCFSSRAYHPADVPYKPAWGKTIQVFQRSQISYPGGNTLCSPTAVSMLLRHWADTLHRPELDRDVPLVQSGACDATDPNTGNWPFSTAFAGSFDGLEAFVTRLSGIPEAERLIAGGIPIACSVDYTLLQGKVGPKAGHLVVLLGFTAEGDPVFNDPGWSKDVRQTYRRADFERAWASSGRTVYLVQPAHGTI